MSEAEEAEAMLEAWRQSELVRGLGQVECFLPHTEGPCLACGAVV